jgi:hypothetical protein
VVKRATRYKAEVVNGNGDVVWEVLVRDMPPMSVAEALRVHGFKVRRANEMGERSERPVFSLLDPSNSVKAAIEADARRATKAGNVIRLLIDHRNQWVSRAEIEAVGGKSADRRAREWREAGWKIDIGQLAPGEPWAYRLNLDLPGDWAPDDVADETAAILDDTVTMTAIEEGIADLEAGRVEQKRTARSTGCGSWTATCSTSWRARRGGRAGRLRSAAPTANAR